MIKYKDIFPCEYGPEYFPYRHVDKNTNKTIVKLFKISLVDDKQRMKLVWDGGHLNEGHIYGVVVGEEYKLQLIPNEETTVRIQNYRIKKGSRRPPQLVSDSMDVIKKEQCFFEKYNLTQDELQQGVMDMTRFIFDSQNVDIWHMTDPPPPLLMEQ